MKVNDIINESKPGLWANIHAKQERIKHGSGERMRKPGSKGAPTAKNFRDAANEGEVYDLEKEYGYEKPKAQPKLASVPPTRPRLHPEDTDFMDPVERRLRADQERVKAGWAAHNAKKGVSEGLTPDQQFDIIEEMVESLAIKHGVDSEQIWEYFERVDDQKLFESAAWQRKEGKNKNGGLNKKGVASYRRANPGSKLQTAVTTKPSKLKKGSKAAKRRKSFCARMSGMKGPMKKPNGKPTRKALALRKWNC